jgi:hypothetical protein
MRSMTDEGFVWLDDVAPSRRRPAAALVVPEERNDVRGEARQSPRTESLPPGPPPRRTAPTAHAAPSWMQPRRLRDATSMLQAARQLRRALVEGCLALMDALARKLERALLTA